MAPITGISCLTVLLIRLLSQVFSSLETLDCCYVYGYSPTVTSAC